MILDKGMLTPCAQQGLYGYLTVKRCFTKATFPSRHPTTRTIRTASPQTKKNDTVAHQRSMLKWEVTTLLPGGAASFNR